MGVFQTEEKEAEYTLKFCLGCIHYGKPQQGQECPVMALHALYMDRRNNIEIKNILDTLIPVEKTHNIKCKMYRGRNESTFKRNEA